MMKNWGVIFDSDGVIVDSEPHSLEAFVQALEEQGLTPDPDDVKNSYGRTNATIVNYIKNKYGKTINAHQFMTRCGELYELSISNKGLQAFPGVKELLRQLQDKQIPYVLASSGNRDKIQFNLGQVGLLNYFPIIISGEEIGHSKPEPDIFLIAAEKIDIPPHRCVVIEDSINGVKAAHRAGMKCLAIAHTFRSAELENAGAHLVLPEIGQVDIAVLEGLISL